MNIPEEAMNKVDPAGLRRRYGTQAQAPEMPQLNFQDPYEGMEPEDEEGPQYAPQYNAPQPQYQYEPLNPADKPIYPGGPYESQILSWKKQYGAIYLVIINDEEFVIRPLNRFEYKQILALPDTDPLVREELICETCCLHPMMNWQDVAGDKAGTPARLAEQILDKSNFTQNVTVQAL